MGYEQVVDPSPKKVVAWGYPHWGAQAVTLSWWSIYLHGCCCDGGGKPNNQHCLISWHATKLKGARPENLTIDLAVKSRRAWPYLLLASTKLRKLGLQPRDLSNKVGLRDTRVGGCRCVDSFYLHRLSKPRR